MRENECNDFMGTCVRSEELAEQRVDKKSDADVKGDSDETRPGS